MEADTEDTMKFECTKKEVFEMVKANMNADLSLQISLVEEEISNKINLQFKISENTVSEVKKLLCKIKSKYKTAYRKTDVFLKQNNQWLNFSFTFQNASTPSRQRDARQHEFFPKPSTSGDIGGRPLSDFSKASDRTKRRRTEEMRSKYTTPELAFATEMSLRSSGSHEAAKVVKDITTESPKRASKYRSAFESSMAPARQEVSANEALGLIITSKLSKSAYQNIRNLQNKFGVVFLPPYNGILKAKSQCYPDDITVTETSAEVKLQALLDHSSKRLLHVQNDVIISLSRETASKMRFILKWGCDGSSGQSEYKQKFSISGVSDASVFLTSLVPLQLTAIDSENREIIVWKNPRPSSPRYCRPIRLQFVHETPQVTKAEEEYMNAQIADLHSFNTIIDGKEIEISYELLLTMVNGKVINSLTETTSSMRCHLCNATSKDFNNIDSMMQQEVNISHLRFGISSLHAWIRFFEMFLHIGYKMEVKKWQSRKQDDKKLIAERKKNIQKGFHDALGLKVDYPKHGFGSTNDGNTARRFFQDSSLSARILGVDEDLMAKCHVILQVLASGFAVDVARFKNYCEVIARKFVELYPWYNMPTAVHKILIHGYRIIEWAPLPIGQLSEDAQESRNKDIKNFRLGFSRKCSRKKTMEDIFQRLLVSSDPIISSFSNVQPKQGKSLSSEAVQLLLSPDNFSQKNVLQEIVDIENVDTDDTAEESDDVDDD